MHSLPYPNLNEPFQGEVLIFFAKLHENTFSHLFLWKDGSNLGPMVSYSDDLNPSLTRKARLLIESSSVGAVVLDEDWVFLGWQDDKEIWIGFPSIWVNALPERIKAITLDQIQEVSDTGYVKTGCTVSRKSTQTQGTVEPGTYIDIPSWLPHLVERLGWMDKQGDPDR